MSTSTTIKRISLASIVQGATVRDVAPGPVQRMADSLKAIGQLSPICVQETDSPDRYLLFIGNIRFAGAKLAGLDSLLAQIFPKNMPVAKCMRATVSENTVREQMTFLELADAVELYATERGVAVSQAAEELGFSQSHALYLEI